MEKKYKITLTICIILLIILVPAAIIGIFSKAIGNIHFGTSESAATNYDVNKLAADETVFVSTENKYARLNFRILESKELIVTIKAAVFDELFNYDSSVIQAKFKNQDGKIIVLGTNEEEKMEIYLKNKYIEVNSLTQDSEIYSGKYYIKEDSLEYVNLLPDGKYAGIYLNEAGDKIIVTDKGKSEKTNNDLISFASYIFKGDKAFARNMTDGNEVVNEDTAVFSIDGDYLSLKFIDEKIKASLVHIKNGDANQVDSLINGEYQKQKGSSVKELEEFLSLNDCYDNYCEYN